MAEWAPVSQSFPGHSPALGSYHSPHLGWVPAPPALAQMVKDPSPMSPTGPVGTLELRLDISFIHVSPLVHFKL